MWGYAISKDRQIDYDKSDKRIFLSLLKAEPSVAWCMACGSCAGTCSVSQFNNFSFRNIILQLSRGENQIAVKEIPKCMLCGKCSLVCPRGINTRNALLNIHKLLLKK
jgi:heterodisulfide reductase subunit C